MELAQLEAFVLVAQHHSFSRAADALFLTQPSVTARIQSLERELDTKLFERSGRGVSLTDSGQAFLGHAKRALAAVQEGADALDAVRGGDLGNIRIGASASIATYVLPGLIKTFRTDRPRVHISVRTGTSEEVLDALLANEVHLALCRLTSHEAVRSLHLYNDELVLVTAPTHPLAGTPAVSLRDAGGEAFLFFEPSSSYHRLTSEMFARAGVVPASTMELDSIETTKHMVEEGLGVAILPRVAVERDAAAGALRAIEIADIEQPAQREVGLHLLRQHQVSPALREFLETVVQEYDAVEGPTTVSHTGAL